MAFAKRHREKPRKPGRNCSPGRDSKQELAEHNSRCSNAAASTCSGSAARRNGRDIIWNTNLVQSVLLQRDSHVLVRTRVIKIRVIKNRVTWELWPVIQPYIFTPVAELALTAHTPSTRKFGLHSQPSPIHQSRYSQFVLTDCTGADGITKTCQNTSSDRDPKLKPPNTDQWRYPTDRDVRYNSREPPNALQFTVCQPSPIDTTQCRYGLRIVLTTQSD